MAASDVPVDEEKALAPPGALALGDLTERLGFHLRLAQTAMWRDFAASLADLDLTQRQAAVMELTLGNPGVSQVDLAATLGADRATMMAIVDRLEQRGLIRRSRSAGDRRRQELRLTAEGEEILAEARRLIWDHERRFCELFTPAELEAFVEALARIHRRF